MCSQTKKTEHYNTIKAICAKAFGLTLLTILVLQFLPLDDF